MSAIISPCGQYRYRLERDVQMDGPTFAYFGVNPSTADATIDDATVRKWIGFTKVNGGRRFIVGNVFAYRSTDVRALSSAPWNNPVGLLNNSYLMLIADEADILVPCWGDRSKVAPAWRNHFDDVLAMLNECGKPVKTFGLTKGGDPKHPLMLGYNTPLIDLRT